MDSAEAGEEGEVAFLRRLWPAYALCSDTPLSPGLPQACPRPNSLGSRLGVGKVKLVALECHGARSAPPLQQLRKPRATPACAHSDHSGRTEGF